MQKIEPKEYKRRYKFTVQVLLDDEDVKILQAFKKRLGMKSESALVRELMRKGAESYGSA